VKSSAPKRAETSAGARRQPLADARAADLLRYNYTSAAQLSVLLCLRASVIGAPCVVDAAAPRRHVTYVLTSYTSSTPICAMSACTSTTCSVRSTT